MRTGSPAGGCRKQECDRPRLAFSERREIGLEKQERYGSVEQFALQDQRYKLIPSLPSARTELYDLDRDPAESHDLAGVHPEIEQRMLGVLEEWLGSTRAAVGPAPEVPEYKLEKLRALGYVE